MRYAKTVLLVGGVELLVRNAVASDARALRETMQRTHVQTDYLLSYPDEQSVDDEQEARSLEETERSSNEVELVAVIDGGIVGSAGVCAVRSRRKVAHRARFGISILKEYWGMGIGRALMDASIDCARGVRGVWAQPPRLPVCVLGLSGARAHEARTLGFRRRGMPSTRRTLDT